VAQAGSKQKSYVKLVLALAAVYIIWGSTYLGIRYAIETLPPFLMAGTRFFTAGAILFAWSIANGDKIRSRSEWLRALALGTLLLLCGNGGVTWAEQYVASGLAALLVATEPLWVVLLNSFITRKRPNFKVGLGLLIGLAGVALLVGRGLRDLGALSTMSVVGVVVVILAGFAWASGSVYSNRHPIKASVSLASAMQMIAGGALLLLTGVVRGEATQVNFERVSWTSILALTYLTFFGSLVAFTAYGWLLKNVAPAVSATYAYINPVVAVFLGWLIASEPLTISMLVAAGIIVASVALITTCSTAET
jgi:drug/metabolite transporter (DMT)-like permease